LPQRLQHPLQLVRHQALPFRLQVLEVRIRRDLAKEGRLLHRLSSMEDKLVELFTSDRHLRPLLKLNDGEQDAAITLARMWMRWAELSELSPKLMEAAVSFLHPSAPPAQQEESIRGAQQVLGRC
jgi:hypothetical protein